MCPSTPLIVTCIQSSGVSVVGFLWNLSWFRQNQFFAESENIFFLTDGYSVCSLVLFVNLVFLDIAFHLFYLSCLVGLNIPKCIVSFLSCLVCISKSSFCSLSLKNIDSFNYWGWCSSVCVESNCEVVVWHNQGITTSPRSMLRVVSIRILTSSAILLFHNFLYVDICSVLAMNDKKFQWQLFWVFGDWHLWASS